ncbi:MAG: protein phosphatase 2C domain-containing protein [Cyanobacteria bacterium P01_A01_bin.45]
MENDAATLYCPNELCQAPNPLTHKFCQRCSTPLIKRYIWAVGVGKGSWKTGEIVAERYLVVDENIFLDTQPASAPQTPDLDDLQQIRPYLRLIPYRLHVPQVYGVLPVQKGDTKLEILLLEQPPVYQSNESDFEQVYLHNDLTISWENGTSIRQLNWLWQIAYIWQPLTSEGVGSSLLDPYLVRTKGSLIKLLELRSDSENVPSLTDLGRFWKNELLENAAYAIAPFFERLCDSLIEEEISSSEQLVALLDKGIAQLGRSQSTKVAIATKTDTGPSRQRNEDACYPPNGSHVVEPATKDTLTIVCDGIGGHEGGNVASSEAIETIKQQLQPQIAVEDEIQPMSLLAALEQAAAAANDKISQRNDSENRQGRQRMGTTAVIALPIANHMYIAHVGDSRAYWINKQGCYQVTLDDDVASREVRLGYAIYRDAVQQSASGSLVQALGMSPSASLHPTAQRFILDEDSIFLLCSDGLSDLDRVEQYWEAEILPVLEGKQDLVTMTQKLVDIANTENGHDNVTVALIHYQTNYSEPQLALSADIANSDVISRLDYSQNLTSVSRINKESTQQIQSVPDTAPVNRSKISPHLIILPLIMLGGGLLAYIVTQLLSPELSRPKPQFSSPKDEPTGITIRTKQPQNPSLTKVTDRFTVSSKFNSSESIEMYKLLRGETSPENITGEQSSFSYPIRLSVTVPSNAVLEILEKKPVDDSSVNDVTDYWLRLRICSLSTAQVKGNNNSQPFPNNYSQANTGEELWIKQSKLGSKENSISSVPNSTTCLSTQDNSPPVSDFSSSPSQP